MWWPALRHRPCLLRVELSRSAGSCREWVRVRRLRRPRFAARRQPAIKINRPVTNRKKAVREGRNLLFTTDLQGAISHLSPDFIEISGFTDEALLHRNQNIVRHPDMPPQALRVPLEQPEVGQALDGYRDESLQRWRSLLVGCLRDADPAGRCECGVSIGPLQGRQELGRARRSHR